MRLPALPSRLHAFVPLVLVGGSALGWLASCGPEGAAPEHVRTTNERLDAYCTATVNGVGQVDVENDYVPHVVHCENGGAPYESLKAQAVAARTFLYYKLETSGSINDGTSDQVYSCGSEPTAQQIQAAKDTSGQFLSYKGVTICSFFVAGAKATPPDCKGNVADAATEKYVTYNWGLSGDGITQTTLGWVNAGNTRNRGCLSQWGSRCLDDAGWVYTDILKFYYGMDIKLETATGSCVIQQNQLPTGTLDAADCTSIRGWAQDPDEPTKAIDVRIAFDLPPSDPAATPIVVNAGTNRDDLCTALGSCNHAFELPIPAEFQDGAPHAVYVEAVDSAGGPGASITGSPGTVTCTGADASVSTDTGPNVDATDDPGVGPYDSGADASGDAGPGAKGQWVSESDEGCSCRTASISDSRWGASIALLALLRRRRTRPRR